MSSMTEDVSNMVATLSYVNENQIPLSDEATNILEQTSVMMTLAKIGLLDKMDVYVQLRSGWSVVDNALCEAMGYEPLSRWVFSDQLDHVGQFITKNFSKSDSLEIKKAVNDMVLPGEREGDPVDGTTVDLDRYMWDMMVPWFLDRMEEDRLAMKL